MSPAMTGYHKAKACASVLVLLFFFLLFSFFTFKEQPNGDPTAVMMSWGPSFSVHTDLFFFMFIHCVTLFGLHTILILKK